LALKKVILVAFPLLAFLLIGYVKYNMSVDIRDIDNKEAKPLEFKDNKIQCPQCHMYLVGKKYTAQAIDIHHKTHFFDDPGCLILWARDNNIDINTLTLWVYTLDTKKYIDMRKAFYSINDKTPMEYGFGAYEKKQDGFIDFKTMRLRMLRGEHLLNPKIRKKILGSY
jgi:copper chaperone NosL